MRRHCWMRGGAALMVLAGWVAAGAQDTQPAAGKLPTAEEVITKSIEALGGRKAMEAVHSHVMTAKFEVLGQQMEGEITIYAAEPNLRYTELTIPGFGQERSGTDGTVHWQISTMVGARLLEGAEKATSVRESRFNAALYWQELYEKAECVGLSEVDGRPCFEVVMTPAEGQPETVYYERKSYLPIQVSTVSETMMGKIPVTMHLLDYKEVNGLQVPFKMVQDVGGLQKVQLTFTSIKYNEEIEPARFALPDEIKALVASQTKPAEKE